ncbi:dihydroneopterin aldolase family protein [Halobium salinum]|uniref:Dihydroneopterin aldolase n=1 Tax=Halobium salinum TaxID=1364940 RepID=A0ABD5PBY8_9EURY|nr:dihydroneopterin aldolase family protein [Halobium salinum]
MADDGANTDAEADDAEAGEADADAFTPTDPQQACFEAGIKFGSLYHQFAGTPVSPASARSLERAMAEAIGNQPHCESVAVEILDDRVREAIATGGDAGYTELTGALMRVEMHVEYGTTGVETRMEMEDGYPLMKLVSVSEGDS